MADGCGHLADGAFEAGEEGAADNRVADVQLAQVRDCEDLGDIGVIDAVAGIDAKAVAGGEAGGADEALKLAGAVLVGGVCECAGVELDGIGAEAAGGFDLLRDRAR